MDRERRNNALAAIKKLNAAKHSEGLKSIMDQLEGYEKESKEADIIDEVADIEKKLDRKEHGFDRDYDVMKDLKPKEKKEESKPVVNDTMEEAKDLLRQVGLIK